MVNAADGQFVGWNVRPQPDSTSLTTVAGIGLGSTRQELEAAYKVEMVDSSLGVEFYTGQLSGLLESNGPRGRNYRFLGRHQLHFPLVMGCAEIVVGGSRFSEVHT